MNDNKAWTAEQWSKHLGRLYSSLLNSGFTKDQAFDMTRDYADRKEVVLIFEPEQGENSVNKPVDN